MDISEQDLARHPDFDAEQAYIEHAYRCLDAMKQSTELLRDSVLRDSSGGTHQARFQRDVMVQSALERLEQLEIGNAALCFGRIDSDVAERFYIGRRAVSEPNQEPVIVDWRVPVAEGFYRATGKNRLNINLRRHFDCQGQTLVGIEDERFSDNGEELGLSGTGALVSALEAKRTGSMRDIVSTIQREQDEIIRADLDGVLVVQGGPGTGKTAVALHRAAYLLFTHRKSLERDGVLVIGPNRLFLRYIDRVLPALGESGVALTTPEGLFSGVKVTAVDPARIARLKGDPRMATVIERAVAGYETGIDEELTLEFNDRTLRVAPRMAAAIVASLRKMDGTHNSKVRIARNQLARRLHSQYARLLSRNQKGARTSVESLGRAEMLKELFADPDFNTIVDKVWPMLSVEGVFKELFAAPVSAGSGIFTQEEISDLVRNSDLWARDDIALLDEILALIGTSAVDPQDDDDDETHATYGHIIVDEAQDLSPMQLRMLRRRSRNGSMTVVGDVAQATGATLPSGWDEVLEHLPSWKGQKVAELSVNYRTPTEIMDLAGKVLREVAPHLRPPESVRSTGVGPRFIKVGSDELVERVAKVAKDEIVVGKVAVVADQALLDEVAARLFELKVDHSDALTSDVTLLSVGQVKSLEFDSVVVVEPAALVETQGLRSLYVALTRSTQHLTIVYSDPLPRALT